MHEKNIIVDYSSVDHGRVPSVVVPLILMTGAFVGLCGVLLATWLLDGSLTWATGISASLLGALIPHFVFRRRGLKKNKQFIKSVTDKINTTILEVTGDPSQTVTPERVRSIMKGKVTEPLEINGISGIELANEVIPHQYAEDKNAIVLRTPKTDDGIASFDHLVYSAAEADPDIKTVIHEYHRN